MKVLLIESDCNLRVMISKVLEKEGFEVTSEDNGKRGLKLFKDHHFDLVITDLIISGINGMEVISNIRTKNKTIKIIAMSGGYHFLATDMLQMAISAGANAIIAKPFSITELLMNLKAKPYNGMAIC